MKRKNNFYLSILPKVLLVICVLFSSAVNTYASNFEESQAIITPDVVCDENGCIISDTYTTKTISSYLFKQANYSNLMTGGCNLTIAQAGCAVTAFAMIVASYKNNTSYTPSVVNTKIGITDGKTTCSYERTEFATSYSTTLQATTYYNTLNLTDHDTVYNYIKPLINSGYLVIISGVQTSTGNTHYAMAYGFSERNITYDTGQVFRTEETIYIRDPGITRLYLSEFMSTYNKIMQIHAFKKL